MKNLLPISRQVHSLPVAYELIEKDQAIVDQKTGKTKWVSGVSKQERFRRLIRQSLANKLIFKYISRFLVFRSGKLHLHRGFRAALYYAFEKQS